jgi:hypothetical protein
MPATSRSRTTLTDGIGTAAASASASARRTSFSPSGRTKFDGVYRQRLVFQRCLDRIIGSKAERIE